MTVINMFFRVLYPTTVCTPPSSPLGNLSIWKHQDYFFAFQELTLCSAVKGILFLLLV